MLLEHPNIEINATNNDGLTPLHSACTYSSENMIYDNIDIIDKLINNPNSDINIKDNYGNTPLHIVLACEYGPRTLEVIKLFCNNPKLDLSVKDTDGLTVFIRAFMSKNVELVRFLINQNLDLDMSAKVLKIAIEKSDEDMLSYLTDNLDLMYLSKKKRKRVKGNKAMKKQRSK